MDLPGRFQHLSPTVPRMVSDTEQLFLLWNHSCWQSAHSFQGEKTIPDKWQTGNATVENNSVRGNCNSLLLPVPIVTAFSNKLLKVFQTFLFHFFSVDLYSFTKNSLQVTVSMFEFKKKSSVWPECPPKFTLCSHWIICSSFSIFCLSQSHFKCMVWFSDKG